RLLYHESGDHTSSTRCVDTGKHGVSCSPHPRPIGLPLNPMECAKSGCESSFAAMSLGNTSLEDHWPFDDPPCGDNSYSGFHIFKRLIFEYLGRQLGKRTRAGVC